MSAHGFHDDSNSDLNANDAAGAIRQISAEDFLHFGVRSVAYVRPVTIEGKPVFAVHGADGSPLVLAETPELARHAIQENDMAPVALH